MPVAYSEDLRRRVIEAYEAKEGSQRQLAQRFKVSLSFVRNLLRHYRTNGQISAKRRGGYLEPTIGDEHLTIIKSLFEAKNDLLLKELCARFRERTGISVSITTMHRAVKKIGFTPKKKLYTPVNKTLHELWSYGMTIVVG